MKANTAIMMGALLFTSAFGLSAEDGAALYKRRCVACHGAQGEGKPAMKAFSLKSTKMDVTQITGYLTKGAPASKAPHSKAITGLTADEAKTIAEFVKTLQ